MARPKWVPETDEQRRTAAAVTRAVKRKNGAETDLWKAVAEAHAAGVPVADLARAVGVTRDTIYRHLSPGEIPPVPPVDSPPAR